MKKIICLTLIFILTVVCFSACGEGKANFTPVPSNIDDGVFVYSITRSAAALSTVETAAKELRTSLKKGLDCNIVILKDSTADYDGNYEILVGETNREESAEALQILKDNRPNNAGDFIVKVINDKIVINATNETTVKNACDWFASTFGKNMDAWQTLRDDYEFLYAPADAESFFVTVNGENMGNYKIVTPEKYSFLCGMQVDKFIEQMAEHGYTLTMADDTCEPTDYEISVGDTNRAESKEVTAEDNNYVIAVKGKKIVIKGGNDLATYQALVDFNAMIKSAYESKTDIGFKDGYVKNGTYSPETEGTYTLNFDDEFNGTALNYKIWNNYGSDKNLGSSCLGGTVTDAEITDTEYINVKDGALNILTKKVSDTDFIGKRASTYTSMTYRYGLLEAAVKFPEAPGCCSLWTNMAYIAGVVKEVTDTTRCAFTEVDVIENFGKTNTYASNVHRWWSAMDASGNISGNGHTSMDGNSNFNKEGNNKRVTYTKGGSLSDDYHIYSFYSDSKCMKFAFDGKQYLNYEFKDQTDCASIHAMENFIIVSNSMGRASYGSKWNDTMPTETCAYYDWIRIYQTNAVNSQMHYAGNKTVYPENSILRTY